MSESQTAYEGISFLGVLTIVFITLKLCGVIGWSWWWVLAPLWAFPALLITLGIFFFILGMLWGPK